MWSETHIRLCHDRECREVDIEFLDDGRVKTVEVHHEDVLVVQPSLGLEDESSLELVPLASLLGRRSVLVDFGFEKSGLVLPLEGVGADVLEPMELVEENVLVSLCSTSVERSVPESGGRKSRGSARVERKERAEPGETGGSPGVSG
jgi:hypothetical protein